MPIKPKLDRNVEMDTTVRVLQAWWGGIDLDYDPRVQSLNFKRRLIDNETHVTLEFEIKETDGQYYPIVMPIHYFNQLLYTTRRVVTEMPCAFVFRMKIQAKMELEHVVPGKYAEWRKHHDDKKTEFCDTLIFVLDPSELAFFENYDILYRVGYSEGMEMFRTSYNIQWVNHVFEQFQDPSDIDDLIVQISGREFVGIYEEFGLRKYESEFVTENRRKPIYMFLPPKEAKKRQTRRSRRKAAEAAAITEQPPSESKEPEPEKAEPEKPEKSKAAEPEPDSPPTKVTTRSTRQRAAAAEKKKKEAEKTESQAADEIELIERELKRQNGEKTDSDEDDEGTDRSTSPSGPPESVREKRKQDAPTTAAVEPKKPRGTKTRNQAQNKDKDQNKD